MIDTATNPMIFSFHVARLATTHQSKMSKPRAAGPMKPSIKTPKLGDSNKSGSLRSNTIDTTKIAAGHHRKASCFGLVKLGAFVCSEFFILFSSLVYVFSGPEQLRTIVLLCFSTCERQLDATDTRHQHCGTAARNRSRLRTRPFLACLSDHRDA